jgi:acetate kinase
VHGGAAFREPVLISDEVLDEIRRVAELAPLHNGPALEAIEATSEANLEPRVPMVACFDTAFHAEMPARASSYAIPHTMADRFALRRYGFHGLAHRYMADRLKELQLGRRQLVTLQLGAGCSAAAVAEGRSIDTSMGLTPLEGLVMASRSGDVDAAIAAILEEHGGLSAVETVRILNEESGLVGLSGRSGDVRDLLQAEQEGDLRSKLALEVYCYRVRKYIAAYMAALGGADAVVFGGGVGEHCAEIRRRICAGMEWCGLELDQEANEQAIGREARIDAGGRVAVWVVLVDEAEVMARDAAACLGAAGRSE